MINDYGIPESMLTAKQVASHLQVRYYVWFCFLILRLYQKYKRQKKREEAKGYDTQNEDPISDQ
jgi:hypothetical protein